MYKKIGDYGIIGNFHSLALVGLDGSVDWLCFPHIDSPSVFGALLDDEKGGRFSLAPVGAYDSVAEYVPGTNILRTRFRTRGGSLHITDFMPMSRNNDEVHELYRLVEGIEGAVELGMVFDPRFAYARAATVLTQSDAFIRAEGNNERMVLSSTRGFFPTPDGEYQARWNVSMGDRIWLHLAYGGADSTRLDPAAAEEALRRTEQYWRDWLRSDETGLAPDLGPYQDMIDRSALVLKLLYFQKTGAIAAAATTSLPEEIGGSRNWDYRYTWVRDTSFTLRALFDLGHLSETRGYLSWIRKILSEYGAERLQIMYGLHGEEDLPEQELHHLEGYKGSRPVRIGNEAARQKQLDIYGELMDAALKLSGYVGKIDAVLWPFLRGLCDYVVEHWQEADSGIWEVRIGPRHFVYSKVMCWVAVDRGLIIARRYGFPAPLEEWEKTRAAIKAEVLDRGWSEKKKSFVQYYGTEALDASNLLIPLVGFLPFDDPRAVSTVEAVQRELTRNGFLLRYSAEDGLPGGEGVFLLCTFWLVECLIALGRLDEAETLLRGIEGFANHLGLFSEEYDPAWREALGNFPQAFTHIGYITSVLSLRQARARLQRPPLREAPPRDRREADAVTLNRGKSHGAVSPKDVVPRLKGAINMLRGAFFDTIQGRVAYERMRDSAAYRQFVETTKSLQLLDLDLLVTREERLAFWINIYNIIVIHGVVELGVRNSVKETRDFFARIRYELGGRLFCAEEMEHGILRGNRRPPYRFFRVFGRRDPRLRHAIEPMDPRIHFALVCASSSCPPIETYTAENLDQELIISGKAFVNGGGVVVDREGRAVSLSRVFKWYGRDFGGSVPDLLRFLAPFLYDERDRKFLEKNADRLKVAYQDYDWRLNRG